MFKSLRCEKQILLYDECLEEELIHIPRKVWNIYTMNDQEKKICNKIALEKWKMEMEILTNRRKHFQNSIDTTDKELKQFLGNKSIPEILKRQVLSEWGKKCQKDISRLQEIWKKKNRRSQKSFWERKSIY